MRKPAALLPAFLFVAAFLRKTAALTLGATSTAGVSALLLWLTLPSDYIMVRALGTPEDERVLTISEGLTEVIAVTEQPGEGLTLTTNRHAMSSTLPLAQRYMRALAHVPLLSMQDPRTVLVIGFGVGNTTHAATLHPSVERVDLAESFSKHPCPCRLFP